MLTARSFCFQGDKPLPEESGSSFLPIQNTCMLGQAECVCVWEDWDRSLYGQHQAHVCITALFCTNPYQGSHRSPLLYLHMPPILQEGVQRFFFVEFHMKTCTYSPPRSFCFSVVCMMPKKGILDEVSQVHIHSTNSQLQEHFMSTLLNQYGGKLLRGQYLDPRIMVLHSLQGKVPTNKELIPKSMLYITELAPQPVQ